MKVSAWKEYKKIADPTFEGLEKIADSDWEKFEKIADSALEEYQEIMRDEDVIKEMIKSGLVDYVERERNKICEEHTDW